MTVDLDKRATDADTSEPAGERQPRPLVTPLRAVLIAAAAQVFVIWVHLALLRVRVTDFIQIGQQFGRPVGLDALTTTPVGYDGQFFYFIARFSGHLPPGVFDVPALRYSRIAYPALVRVFSLGNVYAIPWVMLGVNVAAIAGTTALVSWLVARLGGPAWIALAAGLYSGQALALLRDLSDPVAICFAALALVGITQRRWVLVAAALGLGMLDRESTLLFVICCALPLLRAHRWRMLALYGGLALGPYLVWQLVLRWWLGGWGWQQTTQINALLPLPFVGLGNAQNAGLAVQMFLFACVPALIAIGAGIVMLRRRLWDDPLALVAASAAILYGTALLFQPGIHWQDIWEPYRLALPIPLLLPILFCLLRPRHLLARRGWYFLFACLMYTFLMAPIAV